MLQYYTLVATISFRAEGVGVRDRDGIKWTPNLSDSGAVQIRKCGESTVLIYCMRNSILRLNLDNTCVRSTRRVIE